MAQCTTAWLAAGAGPSPTCSQSFERNENCCNSNERSFWRRSGWSRTGSQCVMSVPCLELQLQVAFRLFRSAFLLPLFPPNVNLASLHETFRAVLTRSNHRRCESSVDWLKQAWIKESIGSQPSLSQSRPLLTKYSDVMPRTSVDWTKQPRDLLAPGILRRHFFRKNSVAPVHRLPL